MDKTVRKFNSFAEADTAEREFYLSLTPLQRMEILLEIINQHHAGDKGRTDARDSASKRHQRICRVTKLA